MGLTNKALEDIVPGITGTAFPAPWNNANAHITVGDSTAGFAITQTELQAATNRVRRPMESTYPQTSAPVGGPFTIIFRSLYGTGDANFAWQEWGVFNAAGTGGPPTTGGDLLNRFVQSLGTKTSAQSWQFTVTLTFQPS